MKDNNCCKKEKSCEEKKDECCEGVKKTTCCACPSCTCGDSCACSPNGTGCDPCKDFVECKKINSSKINNN